MLELLAPYRIPDDSLQVCVSGTGPHRVSEVGLVHREQAGPELAVSRQPDAVAVGAERFRDRADESDLAVSVAKAEPAGGRVRFARNLLELMRRADDRSDLG